jgi:hypothetical protein
MDPQARLKRGASLEYHRAPWREGEVPDSIRVLYNDEHIVSAIHGSTSHGVSTHMRIYDVCIALVHMYSLKYSGYMR